MDLKKAARLLRILRVADNLALRVVRIQIPTAHSWGRKGFVALRIAWKGRDFYRTWLVFPDVCELWRSGWVDLRGKTRRSEVGQEEVRAKRLMITLPFATRRAAQYAIADRLAAWAHRRPGACRLSR